jgi:hypothetical protein
MPRPGRAQPESTASLLLLSRGPTPEGQVRPRDEQDETTSVFWWRIGTAFRADK